ncbi:hypothetical protein HYH03_007077 [Edaphochlamys debaryana]|uniref:sulfate adenylyltransferase n=1 Tax=Edaphochlamys debaryana TaxID=47281 RepID=A0A835Y1G4_9CHLO|nr:hypothetical protein HYH03_007077 [Edaphochlamys debaryana]|eukprot:KAG2494837.1 hypothetical protein HYH03_007077 [Edaphochlamys debaryana]
MAVISSKQVQLRLAANRPAPRVPVAGIVARPVVRAAGPAAAAPSRAARPARQATVAAVASAAPAQALARTEQGLQVPHGPNAKLVNLMAPATEHAALKAACNKRLELSDRNACDVELLCVGAFSPLTGFLCKDEYESVVQNMRLRDGTLLGLPIVLDTNENIIPGDKVLLTYQGEDLAVMDVTSRYTPNKPVECLKCYGTSSLEHPAVQMVAMERGKFYVGGPIKGLALPKRVFPCASPADVRSTLPANSDVLAFQCRNPIHKAHYELFIRALDAPNVRNPGAVCLVHPTCGPTQDDDIPGIVRFHTYEVLKEETKNPRLRWAYLPYSMHMAGPREAIQHMIIRKNYGCTHFIIGRDMAGCKSTVSGQDFYGAYDAQEMANKHAAELNMQTVPSLNIAYTEERGYVTADVAKAENLKVLNLSGTKFRQMLRGGEDIPEWFAFKSVVNVLREQIMSEA